VPAARLPGSAPVDDRLARGSHAEERAAQALLRAGYRIVERNFRCRLGELDLVARDGDTLVFVEVRSRSSASRGRGSEQVTVRKQLQVTRVAEAYLALRRPEAASCRFDVVGITDDEIEIVRDAWRPGLP